MTPGSRGVLNEPIVFGADAGIFGMLTLPANADGAPGVVLCAPFAHPNVYTYRPLRTLAQRIAEQGRPVLRFDWPGTGDSADPSVEAGRSWLDVWLDAAGHAIEALRRTAAVEQVALVGLRVGATLALVASEAEPAVTEVCLLAPYAHGRAYLREARAFQALAESVPAPPGAESRSLPEGALESSGFLLRREEVEALEGLDPAERDLSVHASRRFLIVTSQPDAKVTLIGQRLAAAGAAVTSREERDLERVLAGTGTSVMTRSTSRLVCRWLAEAQVSQPADRAEPRPPVVAPRSIDCGGCRERPIVLDTPRGRLVAVACEPPAARRPGDWVVFLNSGRVRRIGPNRLVTNYARAWARLGVPSLRLDLGGIGDSDGEFVDDEVFADYDEAWYYRSRFGADVRDALDLLAREAGATRFATIGLCSGATWAFQAALADDRVAGAALVNPRVLIPDPRGRPLRAWARMRGLLVRPWLWPALRGQGVRTLVADAARGAGLAFTGRGDPAWQHDLVLDVLGRLRARRTTLSMIFTAGDAGIDYLERHLGPGYRSIVEAHEVAFDLVTGPDHTFRPLWSHAVLRGLLERHLAATGFLDEHVADAA